MGTGNLLGAGDWSAFLGILAAGARNSLSDEALEQAIERVKSWNDFPKAQTRLLALFDFLDRYVDEKPKLLIFAGFPGLCEWLSEELQTRYGPVAVVEFREALPDDEKERNVERFREHNETWIMVSDESGGEGRNFQFASELIQFDTPWFAGRVEQRIGRLDRMGRERVALNVTTHVFFPEGTLEEGLVHTFNNGLGVYRRSISGLEFALRDVEQTLIERALQEDGFDALIQYAPTLNEIAEAERNRSESEVVLDEASFERNAAERYLHVSQQDGAERMLEGAFVHHLDNLASIDAHDFGAKRAWDDTFPDSIWKFFPERVKGLTIPSDMLIAKEYIQGTFRREVAQTRPHISFMSPGNLLFDLVTQRLVGTPTGRVYAIRCALPSREPWTGFEFVFRARPANPEGKQGILNRAEGCLAAKPIRVFIDPTYQIAQSEPLVLARRSLREEDRERTWFNLNGSKAEILDRFFYPRAWADVLQATFEDASAHAHARFCDLLQPGVDLELRRLKEEERQARSIESIEEAEELAQLHKSLSGWEMVLDSVGFLAINPDIGGKS